VTFDFSSVSLDWLRAKPGRKWQQREAPFSAWIADMDFPPAPVITEALQERITSGDLGYPNWGGTAGPSPAVGAFVEWVQRRHQWKIEAAAVREWSDVLQAVQTILHVCTTPGDRVVVHTPAYPPFFDALKATGTQLMAVNAVRDGASWRWDHDDLDTRLATTPATVLLLCNPHNPTGHCFSERELRELLDIAERRNLLIVADEIHMDLVHAPHRHVPLGTLGSERVVTLTSASKSFNLAGLHYAVSHVGSPAVAAALKSLPERVVGEPGMLGVIAAHAAWTQGEAWLDAVRDHLVEMRANVAHLVGSNLPGVTMTPPDATYLAWLDCRATSIADDPSRAFARVGVAVNSGDDFGPGGEGHVRLNFATSPEVLERTIHAMAGAVAT
ncbi:MAG: MalY/PatB family protein, partial [Ilumatobacteraceae bacterium]